VPLTTVGASYGFHSRADVSAHLHLTTLVFGVAGLDVGSSYLLLFEDGAIPAVSISGRLYGFTDFQSGARAYLEGAATASYLFNQRFLTYLSVAPLIQFNAPPILSLAVGEEFQFGRWGVQIEGRWYAPNIGSQYQTVEWLGLAGQGALGVVLGLRYRFGEVEGVQ
jgi:hypothetical protein